MNSQRMKKPLAVLLGCILFLLLVIAVSLQWFIILYWRHVEISSSGPHPPAPSPHLGRGGVLAGTCRRLLSPSLRIGRGGRGVRAGTLMLEILSCAEYTMTSTGVSMCRVIPDTQTPRHPDTRHQIQEINSMTLKFAFLGAWHSHTPMHVREAAERPDEFQLLGMYDSDPAVIARNQERWAEYFTDLPVFPTVEAVLNSEAEAVVIEGHVYENLGYARQALEAGKHVLLEKPAGTDLDELIALTDLAKSQGLMFQKAYMWRYNPALRRIIELARAGALGEIFYYRGHIPKPKSWYPDLAEEIGRYHGDLYFEMAGHLVDLMMILMGEPIKVHPVLGRHYDPERRWVDNAVVVHEFDRGLGTIDTAAMHVCAHRPRRIEVYGTKGTAIHTPIGSHDFSLNLEEAAGGFEAGWQEVTITPPPDFPTLLRELAACLRGEKEPDYSLEHDLAVQRTLLRGCGIADGKALKPAPSER